MANDFEMERKWKMAVAKKLARAVKKWHEDRGVEAARGLRTEQMRRKKVAAGVARELSKYWRHMVQIAQYRQRLQLDGLKREALDRHLDYMVGATESLSAQLSSAINPTATAATAAAAAAAAAAADATQPPGESQGSAPTGAEQTTATHMDTLPDEAASAGLQNAGKTPSAAAGVPAHDASEGKADSKAEEGLAVLVGAEIDEIGEAPMEVSAPDAQASNPSVPPTAAAGPPGKDDIEYRPTESGETDSEIESVDEPRDAASELAMLQRENEMSIEELRAMYAAGGSAEEESDDDDKDDASSASEEVEVVEEDEDDARAEASEQAKRKHDMTTGKEESKRIRSESPESSLEDSAAM
jgi:hypothetical protein